jgi:ParB/RepB/Spo0J family partition protein
MATAPTATETNTHKILFDQDVQAIAIEQIEVTSLNPRLADAEREDELQALADDMALNGLLQPIGVAEAVGETYRLLWGSRRLAAAKRLGWSAIQAAVLPSSVDAAQIAAAENLHRRAMNPLEEALAVEHLLERHKDLAPADAQRRVGEALGKSATWVRDRLFLSRLCPTVRKKVSDGSLPLTYARILAKVVDPRTQVNLFESWTDHDGRVVESFDQAIGDVNSNALSLHQVPWSLEAAGVAKGCPACRGCPSNSDNAQQAGLFEHDGGIALGPTYSDGTRDPLGRRASGRDQPKGPFCLDRRCFERKVAAVQLAVKAANKKAAKAPTKETKAEAFVQAAPEWAEPAAFKAMEPEPATTKQAAKSSTSVADADRRWRERQKRDAEKARKANARKKRVADALASFPGARAVVWLLANAPGNGLLARAGHYQAKIRDKAEVPKALRDLVAELKDGDLRLEDLDDIVAEAWTMRGELPWEDLMTRVGKPTQAFLEHAFGVQDPEREAKPESKPSVPAGTARKGARGRKDAPPVPGRKKKPGKKGGRK